MGIVPSLGCWLLKHCKSMYKVFLLSCKPNTLFLTCDECSAVHLWIVLPHCILWVSNCRSSLHLNVAVLRQSPGKTFWGYRVGTLWMSEMPVGCWESLDVMFTILPHPIATASLHDYNVMTGKRHLTMFINMVLFYFINATACCFVEVYIHCTRWLSEVAFALWFFFSYNYPIKVLWNF